MRRTPCGRSARRSVERFPAPHLSKSELNYRARRSGAGRRLIAAAEDWTRARGLRELFLRSSVDRTEAHVFYPALGFERSKTQHVYRKSLA